MTGEKTAAQLKNEAEVKRILAERGYSSPEHKKKVKKSLGRSFSFKPFIIGILVIGLAIGGWYFLQNNPFGTNQNSNQFDEYTPEGSEQELAGFYSCLDLVDTSEIALDDAEFWNKHISRYEQTIACYDQYPSVADASEKTDLETRLSELRENSQKAEANDIEYRSNMAQIDAELSQNLARIKAEGDAWDAELSQRVQQRQAESDARQAEYEKNIMKNKLDATPSKLSIQVPMTIEKKTGILQSSIISGNLLKVHIIKQRMLTHRPLQIIEEMLHQYHRAA